MSQGGAWSAGDPLPGADPVPADLSDAGALTCTLLGAIAGLIGALAYVAMQWIFIERLAWRGSGLDAIAPPVLLIALIVSIPLGAWYGRHFQDRLDWWPTRAAITGMLAPFVGIVPLTVYFLASEPLAFLPGAFRAAVALAVFFGPVFLPEAGLAGVLAGTVYRLTLLVVPLPRQAIGAGSRTNDPESVTDQP